MAAARLQRVLYDFAAEEEGELSVKAGQLVQLKEDGAASDGWTLVQVAGNPDSFGYVPADYIAPVAAGAGPAVGASATATAPGADAVSSASAASPAGAGAAGAGALAASRFSSRDSPLRQLSASSFSSALAASGVGGGGYGAGAGTTSTLTSGPAASAAVEAEFAQLFASHEEWFRAASAKRADTYKGLLAEASDVLRSAQEAESRSVGALERLQALERLVGEEKSKWSRAISEDAGVAF